MPIDITKFPILSSENTKFPLDDSTLYRSRSKNFLQTNKNYIATAFRNVGDVIQAGELNEIYERQLLFNSLTHQMWSNWIGYVYPRDSTGGIVPAPAPSFGPGWAGTTPLNPGVFDSNSFGFGEPSDTTYSQVEAALLFKTIDTDDLASGYLQSNIRLLFNTGWYLINDTSFVTPKEFTPVTQNTLYDRVVQASGLKHWYYLHEPILFDIILAGDGISALSQQLPKFQTLITDNITAVSVWSNSTKVSLTFAGISEDSNNFKKKVTNTHDGAYFALDLADKSLCQHIDPVNCDEDVSSGTEGTGSVSDSNPIKTTEIVNDPFFENPVNTNNSDDGNSRRVQIKALPRYRHGLQHRIDPLNDDVADINDTSPQDARSRTTNIVIGNMNLGFEEYNQFHDKVPSHSLCVKCEPNTEGLAVALKNISDYHVEHAPNGVMSETFNIDDLKLLRNDAFAQMKEGLKPRFINNVRVNVTIYDVDQQGQTDAENEWNSHFSELGDVLRIVESTDLRQVEPI